MRTPLPIGRRVVSSLTAVLTRLWLVARQNGMTPARIADLVFEAMETGQFYILADNPEDLGYGAPTPPGSNSTAA